MIGAALGLAVLWSAWPLRIRGWEIARRPSLLLLPTLFAGSFVHYLRPSIGLQAFAAFITMGGLACAVDRHRMTAGHQIAAPAVPVGPRRPFRAVGVAGGLLLWLTIRDLPGGERDISALAALLAGVIVLYSVIQARRSGTLRYSTATWWSALFLSACLLAGGVLGREWTACRPEFGKCTFADRIYISIFNSENSLAFFATFALLLGVQQSWGRRRCFVALMVFIVVLTGSRTPLVGLAVAPLAAVVVHATAVRSRLSGTYRINRLVAVTLSGVGATAGLWLVTVAQQDTFSMRGALWAEARAYAGVTSMTGIGAGRYRELLDEGLLRGHFPHSQYLLLLLFGGLVAVVLYVLFLAVIYLDVRGGDRRSVALRSMPVTFALVFGLTEQFWNPVGVDPNLWALVGLFASGTAGVATVGAIRRTTHRQSVDARSSRG